MLSVAMQKWAESSHRRNALDVGQRSQLADLVVEELRD